MYVLIDMMIDYDYDIVGMILNLKYEKYDFHGMLALRIRTYINV